MRKFFLLFIFAMVIVLNFNIKASAQTLEIRSSSDEFTITDDGRFTNPYDRVNLELLNLDYNIIKLFYDVMVVEVTIDIREVNDGYQWIFIYNNSFDTGTLLDMHKMEHGKGFLNSNYATYTITFYLPIDAMHDSDDNWFYIRYGAEGNYEDTWKNRNVWVDISLLSY